MSKPITPITRLNKFFTQADYDLEIRMAREFLEGDINATIILYRINRELTQSDSVYGEASKDGIMFYPPIELKVMPTLASPENKAYNKNGTLNYLQDGQLSFVIYEAQLTELAIELTYGDYVGYGVTESEIRYYTIVNTGIKTYNNKNTIMGYKGAARKVICAPIDSTEFNAI